ncbi:MAG: hypothetical protein ABFS56_29575 [Pseudomonadota bacterium]
MIRKKHVLSMVILWFFLNVCHAQTNDPIDDFMAVRKGSVADDSTLMMFRVDLNGDGVNEVFLSTDKDINGKLGNIWMVYISNGPTFYRADNLITLDHDTLVFSDGSNLGIDLLSEEAGDILIDFLNGNNSQDGSDIGGYKLLSFTSSGKNSILLMGYDIANTTIIQRVLAKIKLLSEESGDVLVNLLKGKNNSTRGHFIKGKAKKFKAQGIEFLNIKGNNE